MGESLDINVFTKNVLGVMHNMKSSLMAVNGWIDLLSPEKTGEIYRNAKRSAGAIEAIIENLTFALRAYQNSELEELSLNQCVKSAVELIRSNPTFHGKMKFQLDTVEDDTIQTVPAKMMSELVLFISDEAKHALDQGEYHITITTVRDSDRICVRIYGNEIAFKFK